MLEIPEAISSHHYSMPDLISLIGSKGDISRDLLSFYISCHSMLDLKNFPSFFAYQKTKFLLFSVIAQRGKLNIYIGKTQNVWTINNPLIEKKIFRTLCEAIFWVLKQNFIVKYINYTKVVCQNQEQLWNEGELELMESFRMELSMTDKKKSVCFGRNNINEIVKKFFDKRYDECKCDFCENIVIDGKNFSNFKKYLAK